MLYFFRIRTYIRMCKSMRLYKGNNSRYEWRLENREIISRFGNSNILLDDRTGSLHTRLASFIAAEEPQGLGSTFDWGEFQGLYEDFCQVKHKIL